MNNQEVAATFAAIGDILEIQGEVIYKILAYRRAAESISTLGRDVNDVWRQGKLREIPGVGAAIAEKIDELLSTGKLGFYEKLAAQVPASVVELLKVDGVGPKRAAVFWKQLGITNLAELEAAARGGRLRDLPGMGSKSEEKIITSIEAVGRRSTGRTPLGIALPLARQFLEVLRKLPGVERAEAAGSLRRMRTTIGDIDLLVASSDSKPIMEAFTTQPGVIRVLGRGPTKSSVEFANGVRVQVWVHPPEQFGTALQYATGSKDHNVRMRELALQKGLSLSDHSFTRENGKEIFCATEEEVYKRVGLPYIPPELREDTGEIQAARAGKLPDLIELDDLQSDLHSHSTWSDGKKSILDMARAAQKRGLKCLAVTDHSQSLGVTGGLTPERLRAQRAEIDKTQKAMGPGFRIMQGAEVEIRADGVLDYPDDVLASLDIVVASLHTSLRQPRERVTARMLAAVHNPHVDIIGHPTGRLIPSREGADLDMEAVLAAARESGVALEVNANPERLDLEDALVRRALDLGCTIAINTDAHSPDNFDLAEYGIATARRGWATAERVVNTWPTGKLEAWLNKRGNGKPVTVDLPKKPAAKRTAATAKKKTSSKPTAKTGRTARKK
jgi:DNA polymerase (family 10)